MEFDNSIFFSNINYLLQVQNKRTGKFETDAGVNPGYISRVSKETTTKPGIEFVMRAAELLGVSIDTILKIDLSALNPTEEYFSSFLEKLKKDTDDRKIDWQLETADYLNRLEPDRMGRVNHPLLSEEEFYVPAEEGLVNRVIFKSRTYECRTDIKGPCYNFRLKNGITFYIMSIELSWGNLVEIDNSQIFEVWMYNPENGSSQYITNSAKESSLGVLVESLYASIKEYFKMPKIAEPITKAIDAFMQDDLTDDLYAVSDDEIPF
ncbi:hypothetical protein [Anaerovibrio lipolyticus]|uniref:hypothetical protein n=1 Tax=Anaerovibrio lipolyticus TaxID=82374 RepID=UPI000485B8CE|nr:hypothetical protein [Anaerovibrio lipolyticus]